MNIPEFLEVYPRDLTPAQVYNRSKDPQIQASQLYSYGYGQLLHDALHGKPDGLAERAAELNMYHEVVNFGELESKLLDGAWHYRNEINFYGLNQHMYKMWRPLITGEWKHNEHRTESSMTQADLALDGLSYYSMRERYLHDEGPEAFENESVRTLLCRLEGAMQETDATIALLNWAQKHDTITVVPAPAQFEHSTSGDKNANADLLVIDFTEQKMIGVQVKTTATERTRNRYDPDRIVIIDSEDLGNVRAWEGKGARAKDHRPWPGIIAASRVMGIQTRNNPNYKRQGTDGMVTVIRRQMEAKAQLGNLRVDYSAVARAIGAKVMEKL
ncbi:MAG TPA: hypothetical protein VLE73_05770 [Candidatus Saccharimonadales bacterium]|nr:hypothetical protein [Candidatus Saccharimonadales bacterium]